MKPVIVCDSSSGDWEGLYLGGRLKKEDHSLTWNDLLDALGIDYECVEIDMKHWALRRLPAHLSVVEGYRASALQDAPWGGE